jgi:hypothetical protein
VTTMEPENGAYSRRRIDQLTDRKIDDLGRELGDLRDELREVDRKVVQLSTRFAWVAGGLAAVSFVLNVFGPTIARVLFGVDS